MRSSISPSRAERISADLGEMQKSYQKVLCLGGIFGFLGVLMNAVAAHALKSKLLVEELSWLDLGSRYQMLHAILIVVVGMLMKTSSSKVLTGAALSLSLGVIFFSGSLYALALSGERGWAQLTPIGGLLLLSGWALLAFSASRQ